MGWLPAPFIYTPLYFTDYMVVNLWEFYISGIIRKQLIVLEARENICRIMDFLMIHLIGVFGIFTLSLHLAQITPTAAAARRNKFSHLF